MNVAKILITQIVKKLEKFQKTTKTITLKYKMSKFKNDPENYHKMSEPHDTPDKANEDLQKFYDKVSEARKEFMIADILVIIKDSVRTPIPLITESDTLIVCICTISSMLMLHQITEKERCFTLCKKYDENVTAEIFDKAINICKQRTLITGEKGDTIYQTQSTRNKMSLNEIMDTIQAIK